MTPAAPEVRVARVSDLPALGAEVAEALVALILARQSARAIPCIALTGGRAGEQVLRALGERAQQTAVDWSRVRLIWGDERWLPKGDADRNDALADAHLLAQAPFNRELVHRVAYSDSSMSLDEAAHEYAELVAGIDIIDVALNGVGEDGHVASLFPGRPDLLRADERTPAALPVRDSPKPPPERVTLSVPTLQRAERVWMFAAGAGKAAAVGEVLAGGDLPASLISGRRETVLWADAAALAGE